MDKEKIIKAMKDEKFRESLSESERAQLPANPAGAVELSDSELDAVAGGVTGSSPDVCSCIKTQTGTGAGCNCTCPDETKDEILT